MSIEKFGGYVPSNEFSETEKKVETLKEIIVLINNLKKFVTAQNFSSVHRTDTAEKLFNALDAIIRDEVEICQDSSYQGRNGRIGLLIAEAQRIIDYDSEFIRTPKTKA